MPDPVVATLPDQGIEKGAASAEKRKAKEMDKAGHESPEPLRRRPAEPTRPRKINQCLMCKKRHYPYCKMPDDFRKKMRDRKRAKAAEAKAKALANAKAGQQRGQGA